MAHRNCQLLDGEGQLISLLLVLVSKVVIERDSLADGELLEVDLVFGVCFDDLSKSIIQGNEGLLVLLYHLTDHLNNTVQEFKFSLVITHLVGVKLIIQDEEANQELIDQQICCEVSFLNILFGNDLSDQFRLLIVTYFF